MGEERFNRRKTFGGPEAFKGGGKHLGRKTFGDGKISLKENIWEAENIWGRETFGRGKHLRRKDLIEGKHLGSETF